jgi:hypothetical protein
MLFLHLRCPPIFLQGKGLQYLTVSYTPTGHTRNVYEYLLPRVLKRLSFHVSLHSFVSDPPEIEVERSWVHTGEGYEAQLVCIVHGEPAPEVSTPLLTVGVRSNTL